MRIIAREMVTLQGFLAKLRPEFDGCPNPCAGTVGDERPKDLPGYCDECEVKRQLDFFEQSARHELDRRFDAGECPKSFDGLVDDVLRLMKLTGKYRRGRLPPGVDAVKAQAIEVVRAEQRRPERVRVWELSQRPNNQGA